MSLGDLKRYAFINAKLRSRIAQMFDERKIETLINCTSLEELFHHLKGSSYEPLLEIYDQSGDIQRLEAFLFALNVELNKEVESYMDGHYRSVIEALRLKLEVENLKSVIRLWFSNNVKGQNIDYRYGYLYHKKIVNEIDYPAIINAQSFNQIVEALKGTIYEKEVSSFDFQKISAEGLFTLETLLDQTWFSFLRQSISKIKNEDKNLINEVLDRDADLKNTINLVRFGFFYGLPPSSLRRLMLEGGQIVKSKEFEAYLAADFQNRSIISLIEPQFPKLAEKLRQESSKKTEEQTLIVESYLFEVRRKSFNTMLRGYPFNFGIILAYFFLSERQNLLIRRIINGINYSLKPDLIRESVV